MLSYGLVLTALALTQGPSLLLASLLALLFFQVFAYFVVSFYLSEKRKVQLLHIAQEFRRDCSETSHAGSETSRLLGQNLEALSHQLHGLEFRFGLGRGLKNKLGELLERMIAWWSGEDIRSVREWLLLSAAGCHVQRIRLDPLCGEAHASLGSTCVYLADLWMSSKVRQPEEEVSSAAQFAAQRAQLFLQVALEEFVLLLESTEPTPELYQQLAACYQRLDNREKQAESYGRVLALDPERADVRLHLGQLHFALGQQRKGLEIYAHFKERGDDRATDLLQHYGAQRILALSTGLHCP